MAPNLTATYQVRGTRSSMPSSRKRPLSSLSRASQRCQMQRLSDTTDVIYIHVDMDVLDPREVPGHPLTVAGGPSSTELAAALTEMFKYEKAAAFGVASTPFGDRDRTSVSQQAAYPR